MSDDRSRLQLLGRIAELELTLEGSRGATRELERLLETSTRDLYVATEKLKQQSRVAQQHSTLGVLAEHESFEEASRQLLRSLCTNLGWAAAVLWQCDSGTSELRCEQVWTERGADQSRLDALLRRRQIPRGQGLPGLAWQNGTASSGEDLEPSMTGALGESGPFPACAFPVQVHKKTYAVIEFYAATSVTCDDEMLETLDGIGIQLGKALERRLEHRDLRARDLAVARRIQTSILPRNLRAEGFELAALMVPAEEVGGDYYDVRSTDGALWVGIGDVSGHGLVAGLIMLMVQSGVASLVSGGSGLGPAAHVSSLNRMLHDNIRARMLGQDFVTFMLGRFEPSGRVLLAGTHEDVLVARAAGGPCERIHIPGAWLGAVPDISAVVTEVDLNLAPGDVVVLYTDGVTESPGRDGERFGLDQLTAVVERERARSPALILDEIYRALSRFKVRQEDDETVVVVRRS